MFQQRQTGNDKPPKNRLAPLQVPTQTPSGRCGTGTTGQAPDMGRAYLGAPMIDQSINL